MKPLTKPFPIAGVKYSDISKLTHIPPGALVTISHQPSNEYDPFALEARIIGVKVGYIPKTEQAPWFYHTLNNVAVICRVVEDDSSEPPYESLKVVLECDEKYATAVLKVGAPT